MKRFKEGSTWAGIAAFLQMAAALAPPNVGLVLHTLTAVAVAVAGALPDQGAAAPAA
ncbi:hypothetical protein [Janthinobacterium sp.]|uniref:hypothetical protein n=1 Tax=Janthinobacterium sp. TaxID=1871054 RepID=UPI00293D43C6|nr:hypothetical protein [Janthinobacterium sp.]